LLTPTVVYAEDTGLTEITCGTDHACAVSATSGVACWGSNRFGQITGTPDDGGCNPPAVRFREAGLPIDYFDVEHAAANSLQTCVIARTLTTPFTVLCWGLSTVAVPGAVTIDGASPQKIAAGGGDVCAWVSGGLDGAGLYCWGENDAQGQLGMSGAQESFRSVGQVASLAVSATLSCYELDGGFVCAGAPNGTTDCSSSDGGVQSSSIGQSPAPGWFSNCYVQDASFIVCYGDNSSCPIAFSDGGACTEFERGTGGNNVALPGAAPRDVKSSAVRTCYVDAGYGLVPNYESVCDMGGTCSAKDEDSPYYEPHSWVSNFVCAHGADRDSGIDHLYCWGSNSEGELGRGASGDPSPAPERVLAPIGAPK
jgi:hypothetical protein